MTHVRAYCWTVALGPIHRLTAIGLILDTLSDRCLYHVNVFALNDVHLSEAREVLERLGLGYVVLFII